MCRVNYNYRQRNREADKFRNTQLWRRKSAEIKERDCYCCRWCLQAGVLTTKELSVHHIIALTNDYDRRLDNDNLITLCRLHHDQAERGAIKAIDLQRLTEQSVDISKGRRV